MNDQAVVINMDAALNSFVDRIQAKANARYAKDMPNLNAPDYVIARGKKYAKIISQEFSAGSPKAHSRSVFCFVNLENGDVLKAASWAAPAKHARGNIFNADNGAGAVGDYGANYL